CSAGIVRRQLATILKDFRPAAVKTGMLFSATIIRTVASFFSRRGGPPLVVDPVMVSSSGRPLLQPAARRALCDELIPRATLLTPNVQETEVFLGRQITDLTDLRSAAKQMHMLFGCAILAKGGHLRGNKRAVDVLFDGEHELLLPARFVEGIRTHGTGCTYSA